MGGGVLFIRLTVYSFNRDGPCGRMMTAGVLDSRVKLFYFVCGNMFFER